MQIRRSVFWFVAIVAVLIAIILWFGKKQPVATTAAVVETNTTPTAAATTNALGSTPVHINALTVKTTNGVDLSKSPPENKGQRMLQILSTYNDVPIDFYGRVEDQFSNAVAGATINFNVRVYSGYESTVKRGEVKADDNGFFSITGYKGQDLGLVPQKDGYALATTETLFKYSHMEDQPYVSDVNNPTVVKMWKLQGVEPLVGINQHYKLHYTSAPINFDLLAGKIVPSGGDIQLTVNRAAGVISGRNRLDWSVQVAAVGGGVMDSGGQERVTYAAPADGYQPSMTFIFSTNAPYKWFGGFDQGFFMMSRKGQVYSKVGLSFDINDAPDGLMSVTFGGVANANASRNWEGDQNTMKIISQ